MATIGVIEKADAQTRAYYFSFASWAEIIAGATIVSATITYTVPVGAAGLALSSVAPNTLLQTIGGVNYLPLTLVTFTAAGGTAGYIYRLTCSAFLSAGFVGPLVQRGDLSIF